MQKWEYMLIRFYKGDEDLLRARYANKRELPGWKSGLGVIEYYEQLGEQGWELVTVQGHVHYFKRAKP